MLLSEPPSRGGPRIGASTVAIAPKAFQHLVWVVGPTSILWPSGLQNQAVNLVGCLYAGGRLPVPRGASPCCGLQTKSQAQTPS